MKIQYDKPQVNKYTISLEYLNTGSANINQNLTDDWGNSNERNDFDEGGEDDSTDSLW